MKRLLTGIGLTILLFVPAVAYAQIFVAGEGPVVYGHHHLNTTNMDAQKKFCADTLGGTVAKRVRSPAAGDHQVPECADLFPSDAGADGWLNRHDG